MISVRFSGTDLPYSAYGKYYIRTADEDRELSPAELRKIMIGKEYEDNWENHTTGETIEDVDEQTIQRFYRSATECGRLPDVGDNNAVLLNKLGLLNGDKLTNAGRCLFSKNNPIMLKLAVFATDHKTTFLDMAQIEGNIFQLIDAAMNYIVRNIRWRVNLSEDGIHRTETPEIPIEVLREAIINSFAHARYDIPIRHEIDIYSNRISIIIRVHLQMNSHHRIMLQGISTRSCEMKQLQRHCICVKMLKHSVLASKRSIGFVRKMM